MTAVLAQLAITFFNDVHLDLYTLNEGLLCGASFAVTVSFIHFTKKIWSHHHHHHQGLLGISAARWLSPRLGTLFLLASALAAILAVSQLPSFVCTFEQCLNILLSQCLHIALQVLLLTFSCAHLAEILWCRHLPHSHPLNLTTITIAIAIITIVTITITINLSIVLCLTIVCIIIIIKNITMME